MRTESHISVAQADVNGHSLTRHLAVRYDRGQVFFVAGGAGRPRLWHYALEATQAGFEAGLAKDESGSRLEQAFSGARDRLAAACDALIERDLPDVHLAAGTLDQGRLHVMAVGGCRAYLQRAGQPQRLTSRDEGEEGLLSGQPTRSDMVLEPEDLLLFGSISAFSVRSVARIASVLEADRKTAPSVIASLLTEPARDAGLGAGAVVIRVC